MEKKFNRIKDVLDAKGIKQNWLSDKIGVSTNALSSICKNKSQPKLETVYKIAEVLEISVCDLLDRPERYTMETSAPAPPVAVEPGAGE